MTTNGHDPHDQSPQPSLTRLIKLLKMTTSSNASEALVACRMANAELQKFGGDWDILLRGKVTVIGDPFADLPIPPTSQRAAQSAAPPPPPPPQPHRQPPPAPPRPVRPTPTVPLGTTKPNRFSGTCVHCRTWIDSYNGHLVMTTAGWQVQCDPNYNANCRPSAQSYTPQPKAPKRRPAKRTPLDPAALKSLLS